jgi:hypothetical protein
MRVLLVDVDSKIPNLALMKISAWYKAQGDTVGFCIENPDKVYISCIFPKNKGQAKGISSFYPDAQIDIGGSGIDLKKELPPHIEHMKPDYDLYPSTYSQDYTSRGCIRKCGFCFVPEKEGGIQIWHHPSTFHDDRFDTCMIMDNNLFAAPKDWQDSVLKWFVDNNVKMLSPQGWDIRLLNTHRARMLWLIKHAGIIHFAWDSTGDEERVIKGVDLLKDIGFDLKHQITFYVLAGCDLPGYDPSFGDALYRCRRLREMGTNAFVMRYHTRDKLINKLAKWANRPWAYWSQQFEVSA